MSEGREKMSLANNMEHGYELYVSQFRALSSRASFVSLASKFKFLSLLLVQTLYEAYQCRQLAEVHGDFHKRNAEMESSNEVEMFKENCC